jgi:hypothetical protein
LAIAASHARPDCWSRQDLEAARVEANRDGRPRGLTGPSPQELWNRRSPILDSDRQRFQLAVCAAFAKETPRAYDVGEEIDFKPGLGLEELQQAWPALTRLTVLLPPLRPPSP